MPLLKTAFWSFSVAAVWLLARLLAKLEHWHIIMGLQFENLVISNRKKLKALLNIDEDSVISDNPFFQRKIVKQQGCQIDFLIQTRFNVLYVCEIKFSKNIINSGIISEVKEK